MRGTLKVHSPDGSAQASQGMINLGYGPVKPKSGKFFRAKKSGEKAALVLDRLALDHEKALEWRRVANEAGHARSCLYENPGRQL
jgi:hypothetical protein